MQTLRKLQVVVAMCLLLFSIGTVFVLAQQPNTVAPQVLGVYPFPGEEMPLDAALTIIFNQAMQPNSVEAAWTIAPAVEGNFTWNDPQTLVFNPAEAWPRDTVFTITLDESATAQNGVSLPEAYRFQARSLGRLQVDTVIPAADAVDVAANATITVAFNRPVVPLVTTSDLAALPQPLTFDPSLDGSGEWINTSVYQFTPHESLIGGAIYTATVDAALTDLTGATLDAAYQWTFATLPPEILSTQPIGQAVQLNSSITVRFSQPMDHASTEASFQLLKGDTAVVGSFEWSEDSTQFSFTPAEMLTIETTYRVMVDAALAHSVGGATLRQGRDYTFQTTPLPFVQRTSPANGQNDLYPGSGAVTFYFGTPMNTQTFEGKVEISPSPGDATPYVYGATQLTYQFEFQRNTSYTVTLKAGTEDVYGNMIPNNYMFSFHVGEPPVPQPPQPGVWLRNNRHFVVTGAYRQDTALQVQVAGNPRADFTVYQVPDSLIPWTFSGLHLPETLDTLTRGSEIVRNWRETFDNGTNYAQVKLKLASEYGGALPPGMYLTIGRYVNEAGEQIVMPVAVAVANSNVTLKRADDEVLVWVTDMQTAQPLANQHITLYTQSTIALQGATDADGVLRLPAQINPQAQNQLITVISESDGRFGVWRSNYGTAAPKEDVYVYTDRPLYRPGETLYFRGVYRQRDDFDFAVAENVTDIKVIITDAHRNSLWENTLELSAFGTFNGEVPLPDDLPIGAITIETQRDERRLSYIYAQVAEFRVPEYSVSVTADHDEITGGEPLRAVVNGTYFSGGAVSAANITWHAQAQATAFRYTGRARYTFGDYGVVNPDYPYGYSPYNTGRNLGSGQGQTDANGNYLIELTETAPASYYPERVTIEATLSDESGQYISNRTTALIHATDVYVGLRTKPYFGREEEPVTTEIITVSPQSEPVGDQLVTLRLVEYRWERESVEEQFGRYSWTVNETEVATATVYTQADGTASYTFTPPHAGIYMIQAITYDDAERVYQSSVRYYVAGQQHFWWGADSTNLKLITDKDAYTPGETAEVLIPIPEANEAAWVLLTVEREGVINYEVHRADRSALVVNIPITEEYEPGIYVSAMLMQGINADHNVPVVYQSGSTQLQVEPVSKRLNIAITPSSTSTQPGETVTFDILATDQAGNPVQAEFGLALVDAAILSLTSDSNQPPEAHYYGYVRNYTSTDTMLVALIDGQLDNIFGEEEVLEIEVTPTPVPSAAEALMATASPSPTQTGTGMPGAAGGGGGFADVDVREDFQQTPLWAAHVVTEANGRAQVTVTMPDNLTIWNLTARALTQDTRVAEAKLDIQSTLPLLVRPATPRFFVRGDEVSLAMVINNNTDDVQSVNALLEGTGFQLLGDASLEQAVEIEPHARTRLEWRVKILDVAAVDVTFYAIGNDGFQDASKPPLATGPDGTIPVYRYTAPDTVGTGGVLWDSGARTEGISLPPFVDSDQGELTVRVDPSLAVTTIDSLDYLQTYSHQCIEQTVSRFLPNVITFRALRDLGIDDPQLETQLEANLEFALVRLAQGQNSDGGWGWFPRMESNPIVTAYAVLGLLEAQQTGYTVDQEMVDRAIAWLRTRLINPDEDTEPWRLNRQAFILYVLSRDGRYAPSLAELDRLFRVRLEMTYDAHAYLLLTYLSGDATATDQVKALTSDLITGAHLSATGAHWEEPYRDWWNWGSGTRSTAIVLRALVQVDPTNPLLPNAVRWLMVARQGSRWESTQTTAWAVMALTDWMVATNELAGDYDYQIALNGAEVLNGTVTPATIRAGQVLTVAVHDLLLDELNRLTVIRDEGAGALYYTAHLELELDAEQVEAMNRGVSITRQYFAAGNDEEPVSDARMGDVITVRLTVTIPETMYYFVLEDPLPAGTEAVDYSLATTERDTQPRASRSYWQAWVWRHLEIRDEAVWLYADVLPAGTYVYSYQVRATTPGIFQTMPTHGYAFYFPEVFGRSDGTRFVVYNNQE